MPLPGFTSLDLAYAVGTMVLAALVTSAVLRHPRRHPAPAGVLVIVLVFVLTLAAARIDPVLITALVGSAAVAATRLTSRGSSQV
jgi:hypothetical protein